jgi:hypothetical protein
MKSVGVKDDISLDKQKDIRLWIYCCERLSKLLRDLWVVCVERPSAIDVIDM